MNALSVEHRPRPLRRSQEGQAPLAQESDLGLRPLQQLQAGPADGGRDVHSPPRPPG